MDFCFVFVSLLRNDAIDSEKKLPQKNICKTPSQKVSGYYSFLHTPLDAWEVYLRFLLLLFFLLFRSQSIFGSHTCCPIVNGDKKHPEGLILGPSMNGVRFFLFFYQFSVAFHKSFSQPVCVCLTETIIDHPNIHLLVLLYRFFFVAHLYAIIGRTCLQSVFLVYLGLSFNSFLVD